MTDGGPPPLVDRGRLVEWLLDKARDEDETAAHRQARGDPLHAVYYHRDRARALRDVAAGVERGDPDAFRPPDLSSERRLSGEVPVDVGGGEPADPAQADTKPVRLPDPSRRK